MGRRLTFQCIPLCTLYHVLVLTGENLMKKFGSANSMPELEEVTTWIQLLHLTQEGPDAEKLGSVPKVTQSGCGFKPTSTNSRALALSHYAIESLGLEF